ncbi:hypothetical protein BGZ65_010991, partial [Modicella reniformis]
MDIKSRHMNTTNNTPISVTVNGTDLESKGGAGVSVMTSGVHEESPALRRASSKLDLFKKTTLPKRGKTKGGSKFATISTVWSSSRSTLAGRAAMDLNHFEKASPAEESNDTMEFTISEQHEIVDSERERDVAYAVRAEGVSNIILITRRISDFLEFDEKVRIQFPKCRPQLPLLDDRRKSFLVTTRQFFFPRKNIGEKLEAYLRKVASHEPLRSSAIFQEFLAVSQEGDLVYSKEQPQHLVRFSSNQESKSNVNL